MQSERRRRGKWTLVLEVRLEMSGRKPSLKTVFSYKRTWWTLAVLARRGWGELALCQPGTAGAVVACVRWTHYSGLDETQRRCSIKHGGGWSLATTGWAGPNRLRLFAGGRPELSPAWIWLYL